MAFELGSPSIEKSMDDKEKNLKNKLKALIVDDCTVFRMIMSTLMQSLDVEIHEAINGKEAIELHQAGADFDIILMCKEMPIMDGVKATQILRSMGVNTKIVGVSANSEEKVEREFFKAGVDEYYEKPLDFEKVEIIIKEIQKNL